MEKIPATENTNDLQKRAIEAWKNKSPETRELYCQWIEARENEVKTETNPVKYRLEQIKLNIERGDFCLAAGLPGDALDQYQDVLAQIKGEGWVPENDPLKIDPAILENWKEEVEKRIHLII